MHLLTAGSVSHGAFSVPAGALPIRWRQRTGLAGFT
jgi:hypothetical protein